MLTQTLRSFFDAMEHCILGHKLSSEVWRYVDNRYFQILADTTHVSSGHARECAAFYLRKYSDAGRFLSKVWYAALYECGKQPSVLGFIVENIILSYVPEMGITIDGKTLTGFKATQFGMIPNFATEDLQKPLLLVPFAGNFKAIDCIIAWVQDRALKIAAVQITVNIKHENSELAFRSEWSKILPNESHQGGSNTLYDTVEPLFIWIVEEPDNFRLQPMTVRETTYHTEYRRVILDVVSVCPDLKDVLHAARKEQADSKKEVWFWFSSCIFNSLHAARRAMAATACRCPSQARDSDPSYPEGWPTHFPPVYPFPTPGPALGSHSGGFTNISFSPDPPESTTRN